jgi:hypothetical protein
MVSRGRQNNVKSRSRGGCNKSTITIHIASKIIVRTLGSSVVLLVFVSFLRFFVAGLYHNL